MSLGSLLRRKQQAETEPQQTSNVNETPLRQMAREKLTSLLSVSGTESLKVKGIPFQINPAPILSNIVENLPDEMLETVADRICEMADEIRAIREGERVINETFANNTEFQALGTGGDRRDNGQRENVLS